MGDYLICEITEASVYAIYNSFGITHHVLNNLSALLHFLPTFWLDVNLPILLNNGLEYLRCQTHTINQENPLTVGRNST